MNIECSSYRFTVYLVPLSEFQLDIGVSISFGGFTDSAYVAICEGRPFGMTMNVRT